MSIFGRILPRQVDNRFDGYQASLWLFGLFVALKLVMGFNSILNTESVVVGADGIPLDSFGPAAARQVLILFAMTSLGQLVLALVAVTILTRYRALVPFFFLVMIGEMLGRRAIAASYTASPSIAPSIGTYINAGLLALLVIGFTLAVLPRRARSKLPEDAGH